MSTFFVLCTVLPQVAGGEELSDDVDGPLLVVDPRGVELEDVLVLERPQQLDLRLEPLQLLRGSHDPAGYLHFGPRHLDAVHRVEAFVDCLEGT